VIFDTPEGEAARLANSSGVKYPSAECGRSQLYSMRQAAIFRRASNRELLSVVASNRPRRDDREACHGTSYLSGPSPLSRSSEYTFTPSWLTGTKMRFNSLSAATE
jgi:hypothetical protein